MTIEQSELREKIKREIRIAMAQELLEGTFRERQDHRERIADLHVGTIMALIASVSRHDRASTEIVDEGQSDVR